MTHHLKSANSINNRGISNNNYYGFSPSSHNNNKDRTGAEAELAGGGLSFVIHSSNSGQQNNQQQNGSISSVASSTSSGISSGSSTITKSSTFNGNTFTRSKPKERKPLPNTWQQGQEAERDLYHLPETTPAAETSSSDGPLKGKGMHDDSTIPTLTLSEPTPPSRKDRSGASNSSSSSSPSTTLSQDSGSSSGSVIQPNTNSHKRISSFNSSNNTSYINFRPKSSSTFIHLDGSESFNESGEGNSVAGAVSIGTLNDSSNTSFGVASVAGAVSIGTPNGSSNISIGGASACSNSSANDTKRTGGSSAISNQDDRSAFSGINKMKTEVLSSAEQTVDDNGNTSTGGSGSSGGSPNGSGVHSNLSGEEENFECFGEGNESFTFLENGGSGDTSLQYSRDGTDLDLNGSGLLGGGANTPLSRNSWTRTSLRKSPQNSGADAMGYRRWGSFRNPSGTKRTPPVVTSSNALANQLYRSSSFHSSGRSSAGDAEEMYSDGSLEDEVIDLTHKVHHLEEKMNVLTENQTDADDRYVREKEKNAELSTKVFMLEEQLRETELRGDEKLREEMRRFKEFQSRCDREKQLQSENYEIRLQSMEKDLSTTRTEAQRFKNQLERERTEKENLGDKLMDLERELGLLRDENRVLTDQARKDREQMALESAGANKALMELTREIEGMRQFQIQNSPSSLRSLRHEEGIEEELLMGHELKSRVKEFEEEIKRLKKLNQELQDSNDELNAQLLNRGLEEGRTLLTTINSVPAGDSLAAEFEAMSQDQSALGLISDSEMDLAKVKKALKEQIEVNEQLRAYIDGILLIIVENNPQLLEVKNNNTPRNLDTEKSIPNGTATTEKKEQPVTQQPSSNRISFSNGLAKISFNKKQ